MKKKPIKIPSDIGTYLNIQQLCTDMLMIIDQYDWNTGWADKKLIKKAKAVTLAVDKLSAHVEKLMNNVEWVDE